MDWDLIRRLMWAGAVVLIAICLLASARPVNAEAGRAPEVPASWLACWAELDDMSPARVAAAQALLGGETLVTGFVFRGTPRQARLAQGVPVEILLADEVPLWRAVTVDSLLTGQTLSLTHGVNACLPYPVKALALTVQPMVRGQTALLTIETDRMAFCRADLQGRGVGCYRDGATRYYLPIGVSALADPGAIPLHVVLMVGGQEVEFSLSLSVGAGRYGFQFIDPPSSLRGLMDAELMASELVYLDQWRDLKSVQRLWDLPLSFPLRNPVPISADYGDRRSYGGMVEGYHSGVDYRAWGGSPVLSPADGVVVMAETLATRGNAVLLDHGWGLVTGYWHLSRIDVKVGDRVQRGQPFALVGSTGLSTGAHLHWEVWANGVSVDGKQWLRADAFGGVEVPDREGAAAGWE